MAIHTQESVSGFVASTPQLGETERGDARLYFRFGQEHYRREDDGSFTKLETTFHDLVMFGRSAELAHERFRKGDNFLAEGYARMTNYERDGQAVEGEQYIARRIGHDTARTRYEVDRSSRQKGVEQDAPGRDSTAFTAPERTTQSAAATAVGM